MGSDNPDENELRGSRPGYSGILCDNKLSKHCFEAAFNDLEKYDALYPGTPYITVDANVRGIKSQIGVPVFVETDRGEHIMLGKSCDYIFDADGVLVRKPSYSLISHAMHKFEDE